jgi:hypothetical protein
MHSNGQPGVQGRADTMSVCLCVHANRALRVVDACIHCGSNTLHRKLHALQFSSKGWNILLHMDT